MNISGDDRYMLVTITKDDLVALLADDEKEAYEEDFEDLKSREEAAVWEPYWFFGESNEPLLVGFPRSIRINDEEGTVTIWGPTVTLGELIKELSRYLEIVGHAGEMLEGENELPDPHKGQEAHEAKRLVWFIKDREAYDYYVKYLEDKGDDTAYDYHNSHVEMALDWVIRAIQAEIARVS